LPHQGPLRWPDRRPKPGGPRKQGLKRSVVTDEGGIPLRAVPAPANRRDDGLLVATLDALGMVGRLPAQPVVQGSPSSPPVTTYWRRPEAVACLAGNVPEERRAVDPANLRSYS
jgi:hypothetical protein